MNLWIIEDEIDSILLELSNIKKFYLSYLSNRIQAQDSEILKILLKYTEEGKLKMCWEVICPECYCTVQGDICKGENDLNTTFCQRCGEEIEDVSDCLVPVFYLTPEFKEYIRNGKKKLQN